MGVPKEWNNLFLVLSIAVIIIFFTLFNLNDSSLTGGVIVDDGRDSLGIQTESGLMVEDLGIEAAGTEDAANWNKTYNLGGADYARSVTTDSNNNVYVVGYSSEDWHIKKFNSSGTEDSAWNKTYNLGSSDEAFSVTTDSNNNVYVVGLGASTTDWYIKKFNSSGTEDSAWNKTYNLGGADYAYSVATDSNNNVYVVGRSAGTVVWHIKKFNSSGTEDSANWNKTYDLGDYDIAYSVTTDSNNNVYVVGYGNGFSTADWYIKKFNSSGTEDSAWNKTYNLGGTDIAYSVATDSNNNVYVVGRGASTTDWHIKKFNSSGTEDTANWNKTYNLSGSAYSVTTDSNNNVYVVGLGAGTADWYIKKFNSSGTEDSAWNKTYNLSGTDSAQSVTTDSNNDVYVVGRGASTSDWYIKKFNSSGTEDSTWNKTYNLSGSDYAQSVATDSNNNVYVVGYGVSTEDWHIKKFVQSTTNAVPSLTSFNITPSSAYGNNTLTINTTYTDGDGDVGNVTFQWFVDSINVYNQTNSSIANGTLLITSLGDGNFTKNQVVNVTALATDGTDNSTIQMANITIQNTAPVTSSATITSSNILNRTNSTLIGSCNASDNDGDLVSYDTKWFKNSVLYEENIPEYIDADSFHTCGLLTNGSAYCWGLGSSGQLGTGNTDNQTSPVVVNISSTFKSISAGYSHTCGVLTNGSAYCWGGGVSGVDNFGQLGYGGATQQNNPIAVNISSTFKSLSTGYIHTCGLLTNGSAYCWGGGSRLGYGGADQQNNPIAVNISSTFKSISAGLAHSCGILTNGSAYCWGTGGDGQLGYGGTTDQPNPKAVNISSTFKFITTGQYHTCGLLTNGSAYCWGGSSYGQLGYGGTSDQYNPKAVNISSTFESISAGYTHTCGVLTNGSAYCWGRGNSGRLGYGGTSDQYNPKAVNISSTFKSLSADGAHTCGILTNGSAMCWGYGGYGGLGYGGTSSQNNSIAVNISSTMWPFYTQSSVVNIFNITYGLTVGDNWTLECAANDGTSDSSAMNSSAITILNNAPSFDQSLSTQTINSSATLAYDINCSDLDLDTLTYYDNTTLFDINSTSGLITDAPSENEVGSYSILITCGDGTENTSSSFTYTITDGTSPTYSNAVNTSTNFRRYQNFTANITLSDGIALDAYLFSTNTSGSWVNTTVDISDTNYNASQQANITPAQGSQVCWYYWFNDTTNNFNQTANYCFIVQNTVPTASSVNITSSDSLNRTNGTLTGAWSATDIDGDLLSNETKWFNNSIEVASLVNSTTVGPNNTTKNENWTFSVRVYDGTDWSSWTNSSTFTIQNTAPTFSHSLTSQTINSSSTLTYDINCSDLDSDTLTYFDNTSLFNINSSTGIIIDTPSHLEHGSYNITITCDDGQENVTSTFLYTINDIQSPTITIEGPLVPSSSNTTLNLTTNEAANCSYGTSSTNYTQMSSTSNLIHLHNLTSLTAGLKRYYFQCNDTSGNSATTDFTFLVTSTTSERSAVTKINVTANTLVSTKPTTNVNLTFNLSSTSSDISVAVAEFNTSPETTSFAVGGSTTNTIKYITIEAPAIIDTINKITIQINYNETEVVAAGIAEADLLVYYYNTSSGNWQQELESAVNTVSNYVEVNVTHLSTFVLGKATVTIAATTTTTASESGGGGCAPGYQLLNRKCVKKEEPKVETPPITPIEQPISEVPSTDQPVTSQTVTNIAPEESTSFIGRAFGFATGGGNLKYTGLILLMIIVIATTGLTVYRKRGSTKLLSKTEVLTPPLQKSTDQTKEQTIAPSVSQLGEKQVSSVSGQRLTLVRPTLIKYEDPDLDRERQELEEQISKMGKQFSKKK